MILAPGHAGQMEGDPCGKSKEDRFRKGMQTPTTRVRQEGTPVGLMAGQVHAYLRMERLWSSGVHAEELNGTISPIDPTDTPKGVHYDSSHDP